MSYNHFVTFMTQMIESSQLIKKSDRRHNFFCLYGTMIIIIETFYAPRANRIFISTKKYIANDYHMETQKRECT